MTNPPSFTVSYKPLWKLLIDRELQKQDLRKMTGLSGATIAKLGRDENVTTTVLVKICEALNCDLSDIVTVAKKETK
ncbi:helix-turn-helix domain-containing protein [Actinotignum urinale]|uniref:Helix-turn-helix transcriptional regulator n=1 Tax=Actinotignum urinale TaxID=190146 RepID=A0AAW9HJX2_9ACTO|nr:helix-turn-helix transcriptional regulator [Actinotignum urinale]MDY5133013.1 helix-turn-helix transcriptional regulator [Actinotignum urinale]MDY5154220.1 helix-turn-helix transcriptional regulator [Actinotignum urinale]